MGKYCCFFDPAINYEDRKLTDLCPVCKRPYGFVLENKPDTIISNRFKYTVIKSIGRGFYGATYLCEVNKGFIPERVLLKVIPVELYKFFKKDFYEECKTQASVARNTTHLVKISDAFESTVSFGEEPTNCYVAELQYINGVSLSEYLSDEGHTDAKIYAQIAIDLLTMWNEFIQQGEYHNDLHLENIMVEQIDHSIQRVDAIYDRIRLIAIDLNSVADGSLSNADGSRIGDRKYISNHIAMLSRKLRSSYDSVDDINGTDYRLIETLNKLSSMIAIPAHASDLPEVSELIEIIKNEFRSNISFSPWKEPFNLSRFSSTFNAQTLPSCFVPQLLVDPDGQWINSISVFEPQLITGMRGCGKTMLLKALDIHARLNIRNENDVFFNVNNDSYVGLITNCRDIYSLSDMKHAGISKLLLLYSVQILRAARHVKDIDSSKVNKDFHISVAHALENIFGIEFDKKYLFNDYDFERYISDQSNSINNVSNKLECRLQCNIAFECLADALSSVSTLFQGKKVFFLLDDVSTRYMDLNKIGALLTELIFMSEKCAFKVTTEMQTLSSFKSPGNVEMSQEVRDYRIFDLGADVYDKTSNPFKAKKFISDIINKRLEVCRGYETIPHDLSRVLGDETLINIAKYIIKHDKSKERSTVYHGATALASLCVGDIGDIIGLYDSILDRNEGKNYPVSSQKQSESFQNLCTRRMYSLDRKNSMVRECVKAFAEASYYDLMNSYNATTKNGGSPKIRQYNQLHITNITSEKQQELIRMLVDSGIFVYSDLNGRPRRNDRSIKLAFRKLFGLSYFIPLGNSDRYELSGDSFEKWVENPSKDVLIRNSGNFGRQKSSNNDCDETELDSLDTSDVKEQLKIITGYQQTIDDLFKSGNTEKNVTNISKMITTNVADNIVNRASIKAEDDIVSGETFDLAIFGMGFEDRCPASMKRIVSNNKIKKILLIKYEEKGHSEEILSVAQEATSEVEKVDYKDIEEILRHINSESSVLIDVTGTYKPIIFFAIRHALRQNKKVLVVHTMAEKYYPLNDDIKPLLDKPEIDKTNQFIDLINQLTTGDEGKYTNKQLFGESNYDPVREKTLVGFVSPKNQRIYSILEEREFDHVVLFVPNGETNRDILSNVAGNIAEINYSGVNTRKTDLSDPENVFQEIVRCYVDLYIDKETNFDLALTGSKMQAVAVAVFSSIVQITQCWYVEPSRFDTEHFTEGVGETKCYRIEVKE